MKVYYSFCTANTYIQVGFILPPLFYLRLQYKRGYFDEEVKEEKGGGWRMKWSALSRGKKKEVVVCVCIVLFGVMIMVLSTEGFVRALATKHHVLQC